MRDQEQGEHVHSRSCIITLVYLSLLLDNLLLSSVVPIIPAFLNDTHVPDYSGTNNSSISGGSSLTSQSQLIAHLLPNFTRTSSKRTVLVASRTSVIPVVLPVRCDNNKQRTNHAQIKHEIPRRKSSNMKFFQNGASNRMTSRKFSLRSAEKVFIRDIKSDLFPGGELENQEILAGTLKNKLFHLMDNKEHIRVGDNKNIRFPISPTKCNHSARQNDRITEHDIDTEIVQDQQTATTKPTSNCRLCESHSRVKSRINHNAFTDDETNSVLHQAGVIGCKSDDHILSIEQEQLRNIAGNSHFHTQDASDASVGFLLSSKAFVQLLSNAVIGVATEKLGPRVLLVTGTAILGISAFLYFLAEGYWSLFVARSVHGVASSCIVISGLSTVALQYQTEKERSRAMGRVLGGMAFGVLLGYPYGGLLYDLTGKAVPMLLLTLLMASICGLQYRHFRVLHLNNPSSEDHHQSVPLVSPSWRCLLSSRRVLIVIGAVGVSTCVMAVLEPTLPVWLIATINPQEWKLGSVFIPDSLGYLVGAHCGARVALRVGIWRSAAAAMLTVGSACILLPQSTRMAHLMLPHFCVGLGIGVVDAALIPLLARIVEQEQEQSHEDISGDRAGVCTAANYGRIYAISQTSVCLAYSLGPMLGGYLSSVLGFQWVMVSLGLLNLCYTPVLVLLREPRQKTMDKCLSSDARDYHNYYGVQRAPPLAQLSSSTISYSRFSDDLG